MHILWKNTDSKKQVLWSWYHQDAWIFDRQAFRGFGVKSDNRHSSETDCTPLLSDIFLYSYEA